MENTVIILISSLIFLLILSAVTQIISRYIKIPFTIFLVIVGFIVAHLSKLGPEHLQAITDFKIHPHIILYACLPTLIFESAYAMDANLFRRNLTPILSLAIPGLFISTTIIGAIAYFLTPLDFLTSLLLGAILSATDPVAVIALFKKLGVPSRLNILVEGESLLNDSTAIVAAKTILVIMLAGTISGHLVLHAAYEFCLEFFGGIVVGAVMTYLLAYLIKWLVDEPITQLSLVVMLGYLSFIVADDMFHVSGVMATITSGIMMAGWGRTMVSPQAAKYIHQLLELLAYIANALIFLLVGFSIQPEVFIDSYAIILVVIAAMILSRAIVIYSLIPLINKIKGSQPINIGYQTIMWWGGLRGAIALAIVLSLTQLEEQELLISIVMAAVLFTILVQGLSINRIIQVFKLDKPNLADTVARLEAEVSAEEETIDKIPRLSHGGFFSMRVLEDIRQRCQSSIKEHEKTLHQLRSKKLSTLEEKRILFLNCYAVEKHLFNEMFDFGYLTAHTYQTLNYDVSKEIDMMRYATRISLKVPISLVTKIRNQLFHWLTGLGLFNRWVNRVKISETMALYEEQWGLHQGCLVVLKYLDEQRKSATFKNKVIKEVHDQFIEWLKITKKYLDDIAEEFPEFVGDMQKRLVERMLLHTKIDTVEDKSIHGLLPAGMAEQLVHDYLHEMRELIREHPEKMELDSHELLRRVPFLKYIPKEEADDVLANLTELHFLQGEYIFHQGDSGKEMYLIMRGLVRVIKEEGGQEVNIATLKPGEFFGEIALLQDVDRTASCRAITPCIIYSLNRQHLNNLQKKYPEIQSALAKIAKERQ